MPQALSAMSAMSAMSVTAGLALRLVLLAVVLLVACGPPRGMGVPTTSRALTPQPTPDPGQLVDVGGTRLFLDCRGVGSPTVLLDAGANRGAGSWRQVQPAVTRFTRVCAYDRAGIGRSDPGPRPRTVRQMVQELRGLLATAGIAGPYVLVGHSLGGMNAQLFAAQWPGDVAGLVLVETPPPGAWTDELLALVPPAEIGAYAQAIESPPNI